jgi:NAD(P)-dependent dehydrogenase (short-subunit alcohol dehydrogenase family)
MSWFQRLGQDYFAGGLVTKVELSELSGSVAVVTGAGNGIGAELARQLALTGLHVVLADVDEDAAKSQASKIAQAGGVCWARRVDVSDSHATESLADEVERDFGRVRLLINNAGIEVLGRCWEIPDEMWSRIMRINVNGPVNMVRAFLPGMAKQADTSYLANVCSIGSLISIPMQGGYIASKHALLSYTECLWLDIQSSGYPINVCAVLPGPLRTGIFENAAATGSQSSDEHRKLMQDMITAYGMPLDEAATRIIAGVLKGEFWVSTHPDLLTTSAEHRASRLAQLSEPKPPT